ncbi:lysostaphin resistance A-like protein [Brachybacterium sp. AOP25-B2-12]|uniref:lysostaphin resistance A-like protein n=1 Tax=Brachybacterium sp. AOP25-B2-12 TaxID=3457710 RepID=UPI004034265C
MSERTESSPPAPDSPAPDNQAPGSSARVSPAPDTPAAHVQAPGTPYHRLATLRPEWARPWRPVLTVFVALVAYTVFASLLLVGSVTVLSLLPGTDPDLGKNLGDPTSPLDVFFQLAFAILALPAALLGVRIGGWRPTELLWSVAARFRWDLLRVRGPVTILVLAVVAAVPLLTGDLRPVADVPAGQLVAVVALILVLAPLQAVGEELAFRGLGQQAIGTWLRSPVWAILIPVPLALIGRGYSGEALLNAAVLGLCAGFLAWKTGGLELPILLHLAVEGTTSIAAAFGGPVNPEGPISLIAVLGVTVALARETEIRERVGKLRGIERPAGEGPPRAARF